MVNVKEILACSIENMEPYEARYMMKSSLNLMAGHSVKTVFQHISAEFPNSYLSVLCDDGCIYDSNDFQEELGN